MYRVQGTILDSNVVVGLQQKTKQYSELNIATDDNSTVQTQRSSTWHPNVF